jgi:amidase
MARTVSDAAILLAAMAAGGPDPNDPATRACVTPLSNDSYARALRRDGLQGARIGIPRASFYERANIPVRRSALLGDEQRRSMTEAIDALRAAGATVVDPADLPSLTSVEPARNILNWPICIGQDVGGGNGLEPIRAPRNPACSVVLSYGMKRDFNRWLASLGTAAPVKTLSELREWNRAHERDGALRFGQNQLDAAARLDLEAVRPRYEADRARDLELAGRDGIDAALRANRLDALAFPAFYAASIAARAGYPTVIVPFAPPTSTTLPLGVSFTGPACSEPRLIEIAYAFEQATRRRIAPRLD